MVVIVSFFKIKNIKIIRIRLNATTTTSIKGTTQNNKNLSGWSDIKEHEPQVRQESDSNINGQYIRPGPFL